MQTVQAAAREQPPALAEVRQPRRRIARAAAPRAAAARSSADPAGKPSAARTRAGAGDQRRGARRAGRRRCRWSARRARPARAGASEPRANRSAGWLRCMVDLWRLMGRLGTIPERALTTRGGVRKLRGPCGVPGSYRSGGANAWRIRNRRKKRRDRLTSTGSATSRCARACVPPSARIVDAVAAGKKEEAQTSYKAAVPLIDTLVNKKIIHRNQADRHKSRLAARVKRWAAAAAGLVRPAAGILQVLDRQQQREPRLRRARPRASACLPARVERSGQRPQQVQRRRRARRA